MTKDNAGQTALRFVKQTLFSLLGTGTDTLVLWVCSHFLLSGHYFTENVLSPAISFECANVVNFLVLSHFVFNDRAAGLSPRRMLKKFLAFNLSYTTVFFLKIGILLLIEWLTGLDVVWCNLFALMISGLVNFAMNNNVIFRSKL